MRTHTHSEDDVGRGRGKEGGRETRGKRVELLVIQHNMHHARHMQMEIRKIKIRQDNEKHLNKK